MRILFKKSAERELLSLEKPLAQRIFQKISSLKDNPLGGGSQKLEGGKGYRIRIGNYRVVYTVEKRTKTLFIVKIAHRREIYR